MAEVISAFGVDHTISKSYRKLAPKLVRAEKSLPEYDDQNYLQRMKFNTVHLRRMAGQSDAPELRSTVVGQGVGGAWKKMATASVAGHAKNTRRKGRVLP